MAGQNWVDQGGYYTNGILSKKVREQGQTRCKFRQFCTVKEAFGQNKGDVVNFDKFTNITTEGGTLVETNTMPEATVTIYQGTLTVTEYGNSIPYTGKVKALSEIKLTPRFKTALRNDQVKVLDKAVETQMDSCGYRYVPGTADGVGAFTTNGTATNTATTNMGKLHLENCADKLEELNAPYVSETKDGDYYMSIMSIKAHRGIHDSLEAVWKYTKYAANGEVGRYYNVRVVKENNAMDNAIGASDIAGEAYFFGEDAVMEAVALPEEIRMKVPTDYGRSLGIAWYALLGFMIIWVGDPDYRIIKFDSA